MAFKKTAGQGSFRIEIEPFALQNLISTLNKLDKETQAQVRDAAAPLSKRLAGQIMQFGDSSPTPQTKLVMESITTPRDRLVRVDIGGPKIVGRKYGGVPSKSGKGKKVKQTGAPAGALLWGSEYGSHSGVDRAGRKYTNRFSAPQNRGGYWLNPATDYYAPVVAKEYISIITGIIKELGMD